MEKDIADVLSKQNDLLMQLVDLVRNLSKRSTIEQDWHDAYDTMRILKISERSLYRLRCHHPEHCTKLMGKWYYNLTILLVFKDHTEQQ